MENEYVFLKNNIVLEPLVDSWYAWAHLIAPCTYALNIRNRHLPILRSYISNPDLHEEAVQDPRMLGGPFMEFPKQKIGLAMDHTIRLERDNRELLLLAEDLLRLNELLNKFADGRSLEPFYEKIPQSLKGLVELVYNINNAPSYRLYEPLVYRTPYFKKSSQSFKFYEITDDERTFVFSTPRIDDEGFYLDLPFDDERVDYLYSTTGTARPFNEIMERLGIGERDREKFRSFFTTEANVGAERYAGDEIRLRYFGHACILIETKELSILVDPVISYDYNSIVTRYTYKDLPDEIDYVLITHNHQDHILLETMLRIRYKVRNVVVPRSSSSILDPSLKHLLNAIGFKNVMELAEFEQIKEAQIGITGIPFMGEHSDLDIRCKLCYLVDVNNVRILFAADTNNISREVYQRIGDYFGKIDILFLGLECDGAPLSWLYGPLLPVHPDKETDNSRRLAGSDFDDARNLVAAFDPGQLYIYAMGQEPWLEYIMAIKYTDESNPLINARKLLDYCSANGIVAEKLFGEKEIRINRPSAPHKKELKKLVI